MLDYDSFCNNIVPSNNELNSYREIRLRNNSAVTNVSIARALGLDVETLTPGGWSNNRPLVEVVVGLNPCDSKLSIERDPLIAVTKACGNSCTTCDFGRSSLDQSHIINHTVVVPQELKYRVCEQLQESLDFSNGKLTEMGLDESGYNASDSMAVRISGNITGDPWYMTPDAVFTLLFLLGPLKALYPSLRFTLDTQLNQRKWNYREFAVLHELGLDEIDISVDTLNEMGYLIHHCVNPVQWSWLLLNIGRAYRSGLQTTLSFVDTCHPGLSDEQRMQMPRFLMDGQTEEAITSFLILTGLPIDTKIRRWFPSLSTNNKRRMQNEDFEYIERKRLHEMGVSQYPFRSATFNAYSEI